MKTNAALIAAFLCIFSYFVPIGFFVSDALYVHLIAIAMSTVIVVYLYLCSRSCWSIAIQVIECICVIYQSIVVFRWDDKNDIFYNYHDQFMMLFFVIELIFLFTQMRISRAVANGATNIVRRTLLAIVRIYNN